MKTKHTPGPWALVHDSDQQQPTYLIGTYDNPDVARVYDITKEANANARLIAAAPDLLAFAQMIANGGINEAGEAQIESEARALISKITGEQK